MLAGQCQCCCCQDNHTGGYEITTNTKDCDMNHNYRSDDNNSIFSKTQFFHHIHCRVMEKERQAPNTSTQLHGAHYTKRYYSLAKSYCTDPRCTASYRRDIQPSFTRHLPCLYNPPNYYGKFRVSIQLFCRPGKKPCFLFLKTVVCSKM